MDEFTIMEWTKDALWLRINQFNAIGYGRKNDIKCGTDTSDSVPRHFFYVTLKFL